MWGAVDQLARLIDEAAAAGITVQYARLPDGRLGAYHHATRTIWLSHQLSDTHAVAVLMHEMEHARRGDDGHQSPQVEARINQAVAAQLIDPGAYLHALRATGGDAYALAEELGVPVWVVAAYRPALTIRA